VVRLIWVHSRQSIKVGCESLAGSKYGGYGSFLPTYQRSPPAPQARSPPRAGNVTSRSPFHRPAEVLGSYFLAVNMYCCRTTLS
jgi:hypothetical protein